MHFSYHEYRACRSYCSEYTYTTSGTCQRTFCITIKFGKSAIIINIVYINCKKNESKNDPTGTPDLRCNKFDFLPPITTFCCFSLNHDNIQCLFLFFARYSMCFDFLLQSIMVKSVKCLTKIQINEIDWIASFRLTDLRGSYDINSSWVSSISLNFFW